MNLELRNADLLKTQAYINGCWINSDSDRTFDVINPATGELLATVASLSVDETHKAIKAAHAALPAWQTKTAKERSQLLRRWFDLIIENQEDLARIMTLEQGKPLAESRAEITYSASFIEWFAEEAKRAYGDIIPGPNDRRQIAIKQPIGVVAAIIPWNFPSAMLTRKAGPALAAGCTFIIKPATDTPLSTLALVALAEQAGIPAGVINAITSEETQSIGEELTQNRLVRKISFTGSTAVGKQLYKQSASTLKKVSMELGGNAPVIVFDDADLDRAVAGAIFTKYRNTGQTCIGANRIFVQENIAGAFIEKFTAAVNQLKVGNGLDDSVTLGPLINRKAVKGIDGLVKDAVNHGAVVVAGGGCDVDKGDCFYQPTVLTQVRDNMRIYHEEIFGPVASVITFGDEVDVIQQANDTDYGLAAYCYTQNMSRAWRVAEALDFGMVGVNEVAISGETIPFGGIKESGIGREGSQYGMDDYLEMKYICMGGLTP